MTTWHEERLLIDGELVPAAGGATYETIDPATEAVLGVAADATVDDARRAIGAARRAFDTTEWSRDHAFRVRCLRQLHQALLDNFEPLREILVHEVGAPGLEHERAATRGPDRRRELVRGSARGLRLRRGPRRARHVRGPPPPVDREGGGRRRRRDRRVQLPDPARAREARPALAAGCTVVLKGAPDTPWATLALGKLVAEATDIPPGVVNVLASSDSGVGAELTTHPDVDVVSFTGSTPVGRQIMAAASATVKRVFLELGGKSAFVLLDDGDVAMAAMFCSYATISHSGQGCAITSRLVVPRDRYDEVVDMARTTLAGVRVRRSDGPGEHDGPAHQRPPAREGRGLRRPRDRRRRQGRGRWAHPRAPPAWLLLRADAAGRRRRELGRRPGRALRPGARRAAARR